MNFLSFLSEDASEEKLKHLEHAEDHVINSGDKGYAHAFHNLQDVHAKLSGKHNTQRSQLSMMDRHRLYLGIIQKLVSSLLQLNRLSIKIRNLTTQIKTLKLIMAMPLG